MSAFPLSSPLELTLATGLSDLGDGFGIGGFGPGIGVANPGVRTVRDIEDAFGVTLTPTDNDVLVSFDGGAQIRQTAGTTETHGPPLYALTVDVQAVSAPTKFTVANSATLPDYMTGTQFMTWGSADKIAVFAAQLARSVIQPCSIIAAFRSRSSTGVICGLFPALNDESPHLSLRFTNSNTFNARKSNNAGVLSNVGLGVEAAGAGKWSVGAVAIGASSTMTLYRYSQANGFESSINATSITASIDAALNFMVIGGLPGSGSQNLSSADLGPMMVTKHELTTLEFTNMRGDQPRPWPQELTNPSNCVDYWPSKKPRPWQSAMTGRYWLFQNVGGGASANVVMTSMSGSADSEFRPPNRFNGVIDSLAVSSAATAGQQITLTSATTGVHRVWTPASIVYVGGSADSVSAGDFGVTTAGVDLLFNAGQPVKFSGKTSAGGSVTANLGQLRYDAPQYAYATTYSATTTNLPVTYAVSGAVRNVYVTRPMTAGSIVSLTNQPIVVFAHGKGADGTDYSGLRPLLANRGYCLVQAVFHDSSACASGSTEAWEKRSKEFNELITRVAAGEFCSATGLAPRIVAGGHSFGCDTVQFCIGVTYNGSAATVGSMNPNIRGAFLMSPTTQGENRLTPSISSAYRNIGCEVVNMTGTNDVFSPDDSDVLGRRRLHDNTNRKSWLNVLTSGNHGHGGLTDSSTFFYEYHDNIITQDIILAACDYFTQRRSPSALQSDWWLNNGIWRRLLPGQYGTYEVRESGDTHYTYDPTVSTRYPITTGTTRITFGSSADFYLNFGTADVVAGPANIYFANTLLSGETFNIPPGSTYFAIKGVQDAAYAAPVTMGSATYRTY